MTEQKFFTPLKAGILIVVIAYFLYTLHATFTLEWWGEWDRIAGGSFRFVILVEDIVAFVGIVFRFAASIIAFGAVLYYFTKKSISKPAVYKILKVILVFEAIYWLGLTATTYFTLASFVRFLGHQSILATLDSLALGVIPSIIEAIVVPIVLFILAFKLNPNKPLKSAIKWTLITGTLYIATFWLVYTSIWDSIIQTQGLQYLLFVPMQVNGVETLVLHPEHLISFITTAFGLLALVIYAAYFTKKSKGAETLQQLNLKRVGFIILGLGMYFLWNYISWALLAGAVWNNWYAMFLGHNLDLWMLSLPLLGLPMLFTSKTDEK
jgi:hypothetical protein